MLPSAGLVEEWNRDLLPEEGHEGDEIYQFDGSTSAVVIPESVLSHNLTNQFTISLWLKHEAPVDHTNKHFKEHIICNADDHSMMITYLQFFLTNSNVRLFFIIISNYRKKSPSLFYFYSQLSLDFTFKTRV